MPGVRAPPPIEAGTIIDGKFRVEQVIGEGGMGVVVRARHLRLGTLVALKFLLPDAVADATAVERFTRESRAAARLTSDHVARVLDVGSTNGVLYMVMEFLDGESLATALKRRGSLPIDEACTIMIQTCEALSEAHSLGIVHRDLKPANLFLANRPKGKVITKVLDFGISKIGALGSHTKVSDLTTQSALLGTPYYMSPEQISSSRDVDARADIWSCGVCLFRMITGCLPFNSDKLPDLLMKILRDNVPDVRTLRPDTPRPFAEIVLRCMQRDLAARWPSAQALAEALVAYRDSARGLYVDDLLLDRPSVYEAQEAALADTVFPTPPVPLVPTDYVANPLPGRLAAQTAGGASRTMSGVPSRSSAASLAVAGVALIGIAATASFVVRARVGHSEPRPVVFAAASTAPALPPPAAIESAPLPPASVTAPPPAVVESAPRTTPKAPLVTKKAAAP